MLGLFGGIIGVFLVAFITYVTIRMLVKAKKLQMKRLPAMNPQIHKEKDLQHSLSYAAIATHAIGNPQAGFLVKAATTLSTVGACGGYLIFVVGLLLPMIQRLQNDDDDGGFFGSLDEKSAMMYLIPILIPLTWIRSFKGLAYVSVKFIVIRKWKSFFFYFFLLFLFFFFFFIKAFGNIVFIGSVAAVLYDGFSRFGAPSPQDFNIDDGGYLRYAYSLI